MEISIDKVLFATDFSPATEAAFSYAAAIADRYHSRLYVAHVINPESLYLFEPESAQAMIKQAHDEAARKITQLLAPLRLEHWILDHVPQNSDLRNRIHFERGFGPATDSILDFTGKRP